jgi:molybdopterin synthase catalytic subunit
MSALSDSRDLVAITGDRLSLDAAYEYVRAPSAGAVVTFVGTTRDAFDGKKVDRLEYECYEPMALKKLRELCACIRGRWAVENVYIAHRVGTVEVGETSVIIAVSSAHRAASLEATSWCIDELKATVPIWKKEFFEGGEVWKENETQRREMRMPPP